MPEFDVLRYEITRPDYEPISTVKDLEDFLKKLTYKTIKNDYRSCWLGYLNAPETWRMGQSFMNVLPHEYESKLTGSLLDPFHKDDLPSVLKALDYLILSE